MSVKNLNPRLWELGLHFGALRACWDRAGRLFGFA